MLTIDFDPETHTYRVDGKVYPGVTEVIDGVGLVDSAYFNAEATDRGTLAHIATALDDQGRLDESQVPDDVRPYLEAWRSFRRESKCKIVEIEKKFANEQLGFAGTVDRIIVLNGRNAVLDLKTGGPQSWHSVQLEAYRQGINGAGYGAYCLYLRNDETFRLVAADNELMCRPFTAALAIYQYKKGNGLL